MRYKTQSLRSQALYLFIERVNLLFMLCRFDFRVSASRSLLSAFSTESCVVSAKVNPRDVRAGWVGVSALGNIGDRSMVPLTPAIQPRHFEARGGNKGAGSGPRSRFVFAPSTN
ncbi:hypothetical protein [Bradyrhizobium sp. NP1]|uniref:hypothetical protein n=1 Tax=Bradyrhizobium sp. NP1 TaxID=3049772 RepID=UPI0025A4F7C7|nr:hypothetical protein [Bradyrhizobium sp. NP1]WJR74843.1 hypothetical protein QOU61_18595 [Bradyrhizobium sp. NP1]